MWHIRAAEEVALISKLYKLYALLPVPDKLMLHT
jgi:hypothetical protein